MPKKNGNGDGSWDKLKNKGGDEYWRHRVSIKMLNGESKRVPFYGATKEECREKEREYKKDSCLSEIKTVAEWSKFWLKTYVVVKDENNEKQKDGVTIDWYNYLEGIIDNYIIPNIGETLLDEVLPMHIKSMFGKYSNMSVSFLNKFKNTSFNIFEDALDNKLCHQNPVKKIVIASGEEDNEFDVHFSPEQAEWILDYINKFPSKMGTMVATDLYTGVRRGELLGIAREDLDGDNNIIDLQREIVLRKGKKQMKHKLKTKKSKGQIPYAPALKKIIQETDHLLSPHKKGTFKNPNYLFVNEKTKEFLSPNCYTNEFKRYMKKINDYYKAEKEKDPTLPDKEISILTPKACRHTAATNMLSNGTDIRVVQEILRHTDIKTTEIYTHPSMKDMRGGINNLKY